MKYGFGDFIALAKSGWTPEAVNSTLDRLEKMNEKEEAEETEEDSTETETKTKESENESEKDSAGNENISDDKDAKIAELEQQLKDAQKDNVHQNIDSGDKKSLDDLVDDIFKEFFD